MISKTLLLLGLMVNVAFAQAHQKLSVNLKNEPLAKLFRLIEKKTDYQFIYSDEDISSVTGISVKADNEAIGDILKRSFTDTDLTYRFNNKVIIVSRKKQVTGSLAAQPLLVKGKVTDERGEVLEGVSVRVKGTSVATATNTDGTYQLEVPAAIGTLSFDLIGYSPREVSFDVKTTGTIDMVLHESVDNLQEVVVVGYGTQKRSDLTGAIGSVSANKINQVPVTTASQALQGRVSGVLVSQSSSRPGAAPSVLIRGKRSISASSDPLYVVDGIPITGGMAQISPNDIESMDVLKDASATAIYGARGSNGVIMITTKKGVEGGTQVDYNSFFGPQTILRQLEYMDGATFVETVRESYRATGKYHSSVPSWEEDQTIPTFVNDPYTLESIRLAYDENGNYDPSKVRSDSRWWDAVQRTGMFTDHQLSIRGGNKSTRFVIGGSYNRNEGIYKDEDYTRYSLRINIDHKLSDIMEVGGQTQFSHALQNRGSNMQNNWRVMPIGRFYDDEGNLLARVSGTDDQHWNPLTRLVDGAVVNPLKTNQFFGSYYGEIKLPIEGLRFRSNLGIDFTAVQDYEFQSSLARSSRPNYARNATENRFMYTWENLLFYDKALDNHHLGFTFLQSVQQNLVESNGIPVENIPSDALLYYNVGAGLIPGTLLSNKQQWNIASFMGRVNYNYKSRYLLTLSARYDGASRLAERHKWVLFPAAALAWRIKEEGFVKDISALDDLKLRVGYGTTASSEVSPYQTKGTLIAKHYNFGDDHQIGYAPDILPNPNLTWETTGQWNAGVDFSLLENRISGSVDVYLQNTHDLLINRQLPVVSGFSVVMSNVGRTRNRGLEIALNTQNVRKDRFQWSTDWMFYANKEEIVELYNGREDDPGNKWFIGHPIDVSFDYKKIGIWQNTPEDLAEMARFNANGSNFMPGSIRLYDNGDYMISADDRVIQGQRRPKYIASLVNNFQYSAFDLNVFLYGSFGAMLENSVEYLNQAHRNSGVKVDYWTPENPTNDMPRPIEGVDNLDYRNTLWYEKADFVKVRNISLGYTLTDGLIKSSRIKRLRFYLTAQNPFMFTNYTGVDPEGAVGWVAPSVRSWLFGVNLSL
ncbi:TonB-dependent receptor [Olivibacter sitiensis]|uniref:TonB-dependent receptor n=1 Tax=Olivibacter sitiensis TaxID=376470 RepID=UPI00055E57C0|nr:TonB-dependent receptor [Olivibacter sitiensis]